jgi:23S rRNA (uracil1939-C5)-methyltransferase
VRTSGQIAELDDEGRGVLREGDLAVHVAGALPGERVAVEIEHRSPHRPQAWARLLEVLAPAKERCAPCCPATGRCGGCALGVLSYEGQLAFKTARLARALARVPGAPPPRPIVPSPRPLGYRGLSKLVYAATPAAAALGGYAPRTHSLVDLAGCTVTEPLLEELRAHLLAGLLAAGAAPYDERAGTGLVGHVVLRSNAAGEALATLVGPDLDALGRLAERLPPHSALIGIAGNRGGAGNAIFGGETRLLRGRGELIERVGAIELFLSPTAFFQVNRAMAARLYADLAAALAADLGGLVVDAYAGVGGIALTLAHAGAARLLGIEVHAAAVRDAERAAERAGVQARFVAADAAAGLRAIAEPISALVVNPPRRGLDEATRAAIGAARPGTIAYVSCDPGSLARDLGQLHDAGWALSQAGAYDMHPQTPHVETLAILRRDR